MDKLSLGAELIHQLIPQRRPFLMVDRITGFSSAPRPVLRCVKYVSANEQFFDGHYPTLAIMPGALIFEGLGQCANLLAAIMTLRERFERAREAPETVIGHLKNLQYGFSLDRAFKPEMAEQFKKLSGGLENEPEFGMVGAVTMKFLGPVFGGSALEYEATLTGIIENYMHFTVEACVDNTVKAKGTMATIKGLGVSRHLGWPGKVHAGQ